MTRIATDYLSSFMIMQVRAFSSWPGSKAAFTVRESNGAVSDPFDLKITCAAQHGGSAESLDLPQKPGSTCRTAAKGVLVRCGAGSILELHTVQPASRKPMPISAYLNGLSAGAQLRWAD